MPKLEMAPIGERLQAIAKSRNLSLREMCRLLEKHSVYIHQLKNTPDENTLKIIMDNFPEVSLKWLCTGIGNMHDDLEEESRGEYIREIASLKKENELLREDLRRKDKQVAKLLELLTE